MPAEARVLEQTDQNVNQAKRAEGGKRKWQQCGKKSLPTKVGADGVRKKIFRMYFEELETDRQTEKKEKHKKFQVEAVAPNSRASGGLVFVSFLLFV